MSIKLRKKPAALVSTPDGVYVQLFVDEDGLPKIKDSDGNIVQLSESAVITLVEQGSDPLPAANQLKLYSKDVAGNSELFAVDSDGNEVQITDNGAVAGGGPATALATVGSPVNVSGSSSPSFGQGLVAVDGTTAVWSNVLAHFLTADNGASTIDVYSAAAPTAGQVLTAVDNNTAEWQDPSGALKYSAVIHVSGNFTAVPGTMHRWDSDEAPNAILPDPPANNDKIGFITVGVGTGNLFIDPGTQSIALNDSLFNSYQVGGATGDGTSVTLQYDADSGTWRFVDTDSTRVGLINDQPQQSMVFKGQNNEVNFVTIADESVLGRTGGGDIQSILISSLGGGPATELATSGSPVDVGSAGPPTTGQVLTATSATTATWQTPSGGGSLVVGARQTTQSIVATGTVHEDIPGLEWTVDSLGLYQVEASFRFGRAPTTPSSIHARMNTLTGTRLEYTFGGGFWFWDGTSMQWVPATTSGTQTGITIPLGGGVVYLGYLKCMFAITALSSGTASFAVTIGGGAGSAGGAQIQIDEGFGVLTKLSDTAF